jgi:hypothetical protein
MRYGNVIEFFISAIQHTLSPFWQIDSRARDFIRLVRGQ